MKSTWTTFALAPLAALALLAGACGDDDNGNGGDGTPEPGDGPTQIGRSTPFPSPQVTGNSIVSAIGYTATFPEGWTVRPNFLQPRDAVVDAFFEPVENAAVQANISVECVLDVSASPEENLQAEVENAKRLNANVQESTTQVNGQQATVLSYIQEQQSQPGTPKLDKQDILFSTDKCHWTITSVIGEGQRGTYQPAFDAFVASFRITG
jgi:hypothetical protein